MYSNKTIEKPIKIKFSILEKIFLFFIGALFILNNGLIASTISLGYLIPIFPIGIIGQIILIFAIPYFIFTNRIKFNLIFFLIFALNIQTIISIILSFNDYGVWSLRSATYVADINYIFIGNLIVQNNYKRYLIPKIFWMLLFIGTIYSLTIPFKGYLTELSPTLPAFSGYDVPIFFNFITSGLITQTFFFSESFFPIKKGNLTIKIVSIMGILVTLIFGAARSNYFIFIFSILVTFLFGPKKFGKYSFFFLMFICTLNVFFMMGLSFSETRVSEIQDMRFFYEHFLSSFGFQSDIIGGASGGLGQRLDWWKDALDKLFSSNINFLFGIGQGVPLTDFVSNRAVLVKNLHNSFITILVRNGFLGFLLFFTLIFTTYKNLIHNIKAVKNDIYYSNFLKTSFLFISSILIISLMQSALEISCFAIPLYLLIGMVASYKIKPNKV